MPDQEQKAFGLIDNTSPDHPLIPNSDNLEKDSSNLEAEDAAVRWLKDEVQKKTAVTLQAAPFDAILRSVVLSTNELGHQHLILTKSKDLVTVAVKLVQVVNQNAGVVTISDAELSSAGKTILKEAAKRVIPFLQDLRSHQGIRDAAENPMTLVSMAAPIEAFLRNTKL